MTPGSVLVTKLLPIRAASLSFSLSLAFSLSLLRTRGGHLRTLPTGRECERSRFHVWDSGEHPKEWEYFERGAHRSRHERSPNMDARRRGAGCEHGRAEVRDPRGCVFTSHGAWTDRAAGVCLGKLYPDCGGLSLSFALLCRLVSFDEFLWMQSLGTLPKLTSFCMLSHLEVLRPLD